MFKSKERTYHGANTALVLCSGSKDGSGSHASSGSRASSRSTLVSSGFSSLFFIHCVATCSRNKQIISGQKLNSPELQYLSGLIRYVVVKRTPCRAREVSLGRFSDKRPLAPACNAGSQPDQ